MQQLIETRDTAVAPHPQPVRHKRVLVVAAEAAFFNAHFLRVATEARQHGYDIAVATPPGPGVDTIVSSGLQWHQVVVRRKTKELWPELKAPFDLIRLYRRLRPELVHHIAVKPIFYGMMAARAAHVPRVVNSFAGLGYAFDEQRSRTVLGRAVALGISTALHHRHMRVTFENRENRDLFLKRRWISAEQAVLLPGAGVDVARFTPPANASDNGVPLVILASRLLYSKGVLDFAGAAALLKSRHVTARFAIIGAPDPDSPDSVSDADLQRLREGGAVELWGRCSNMPEIYRQAAVFCLPTYYREGIPKAIMEAAAAGVPSVTTNTPGCNDFVIDGENGLLIAPRDVAAIADAIANLLRDPEKRAAMGERGRRRVVEHFSTERVIEATYAVYDELFTEA